MLSFKKDMILGTKRSQNSKVTYNGKLQSSSKNKRGPSGLLPAHSQPHGQKQVGSMLCQR